MALVKSTLEASILAITEPAGKQAAAIDWSLALRDYFNGIVPPCTTVPAARQTFRDNILPAMSATDYTTSASMWEAEFATFAGTIAAGMAPTYTGTPPAGLVGFLALFTTYQPSMAAAAQAWADAIDTWARTGTATLAVLPFTVVPWS